MSDFLLISALAELSSGKGFGFNSNFLEANVINIALICAAEPTRDTEIPTLIAGLIP